MPRLIGTIHMALPRIIVEAVDHGPMKNPEGWVAWMLERAKLHQKDGCKGAPKKKNGGNA